MGLFNGKKQKQGAAGAVDKRNSTLRRVSLISAVVFIAIILIFNILFDSLLGDTLKWDWSFGQMYSTGDVTKELLDNLDAKIQITGLYEKGSSSDLFRIEMILDDYVDQGNGNIEVRYVDMDFDPNIGRELDPSGMGEFSAGSYVVKNMDTGRYKIVTQNDLFSIDEEAYYNSGTVTITAITAESGFSGAIKYVTALVTPTVYALQGHGESDIQEYTRLVNIMGNFNNVDINSTMNLAINPAIPEDCEMILMANPEEDVTADEQRIILDYLKKGGDLMVLTEYNDTAFPRLNEILAEYNIEITNDRVREDDVDRRFNEQPYVFAVEWPSGSLFETSSTQLLAINARNIRILANAKEWVKPEPAVQTSPSAVVEAKGIATDISEAGVQTIGVICETTGWMSSNVSESSKVVVLGSIGMLSDSVLENYNTYNDELFYYSVNWVTDVQNTNLYISEKTLPTYLLQKGTQTSYIFASATVLGIIPGILLIVGLIVYRRRKNL